MKSYIKIYGQKRTGTNYISCILLNNFTNIKVFMNIGGWKHGKIIKLPNKENLINAVDNITKKKINIDKILNLFKNNKINFIVTIKNPYMWIKSMCNYNKKSIRNKLYIIEKIKLWNKIYSNYKKYIVRGEAYLIKYEFLLQEPHKILEDLIQKFNLTRKYESTFTFEKNKLLPNTDNTIGKCANKLFNPTKYINPNITAVLPIETINIINNNIDFKLMEFYGYNNPLIKNL